MSRADLIAHLVRWRVGIGARRWRGVLPFVVPEILNVVGVQQLAWITRVRLHAGEILRELDGVIVHRAPERALLGRVPNQVYPSAGRAAGKVKIADRFRQV